VGKSENEVNIAKVVSRRRFADEGVMVEFYADNPWAFFEDHIGIGICECGCKKDPQQMEVVEEYSKLIKAKQKYARYLWRVEEKGRFETEGKVYEKEIKELSEEEMEYARKLGLSIRSSKGTGKTRIVALLLIHFMCCYGTDLLNLMTAPKYDQLEDNLISAVVQWISHARRVFGNSSWVYQWLDVQKGKIYRKVGLDKNEIGRMCVSLARTTKQNAPESEQKSALSGFHAKYMMIIADECYGIPDPVYEAFRTTLTKEVNFAIILGNPTTNMGYANESWEDRPDGKTSPKYWINIQMDTENTTLVTEEYKRSIQDEYSFYPNLLRVYYYGLPPLEEEGSLMSFTNISLCMEQVEIPDIVWNTAPITMTMDIGMGGDTSSICIKQGIKVLRLEERICKDTDENIEFGKEFIFSYNAVLVGVDNIGVGKGVYDGLRKLFPSRVRAICVSEPSRKKQYLNKRAEYYMALAQNVNKRALILPLNIKLKGELNIVKLIKDKTPIQIIGKKEMRKALKSASPNLGDVLMMQEAFDVAEIKQMQEVNDEEERYGRRENQIEGSFMSV
jgi:hypothetical protein